MKEFVSGFRYALEGFRLIKHPSLRRFVAIPFAINVLLFSLGLWYLASEFSAFMAYVPEWLPESLDLPGWLDWLNTPYGWLMSVIGWLRYLLWILFFALYLILVFYAFTVVANIISAPFNGLFAAAVEELLTGQTPEGHVERTLMEEVKAAMISEARKLFYMLKCLGPLLVVIVIMFFTAIAQPLIPVVWFFFGAWMLSIEYADYPMGNYGLSFAEEKAVLKQRRSLAMGFGSSIMLMTMVPLLNFFAVPVGVAGATKLYVDKFHQGGGKQAKLEQN